MGNSTQVCNGGVNHVDIALMSRRITQSFNTWAFKRQQPSSSDLLQACVRSAVQKQTPLEFVLYWGKGPRSDIADPDMECLSYLFSMKRRIEAHYAPGTQFTLLLTDTHARLNNHCDRSTDQYFREISDAANSFNFSSRRLSDVVKFALPNSDAADAIEPLPETLAKLTQCAAKWYAGDGFPEEAASAYFEMNMQEKRAVERTFPHAIFVTFNSSQFRVLFPDALPIFYMYSLRKGCAVKPWFMPATESDNDQLITHRRLPLGENRYAV